MHRREELETGPNERTTATEGPGRAWYKRPFDLTIVVLAHVALLPLWVLLWLLIPPLIRLGDRGPVFYRQSRVGYGGRVFTVLKFRTMIPDAEASTGPMWAQVDDTRVTRVGRVLRRTALDELPQLINILRGEMSLVGPRAERPELHAQFLKQVPGWERRLEVQPGLTGWAQVSGGYNLSPELKLRNDLHYIEHRSMWLDLKILYLSLIYTLSGKWDERSVNDTVGSR